MYERLPPSIRQVMPDPEILSAVKTLAGTRSAFSVAEINALLENPRPIEEIMEQVLPSLPGLELAVRRAGNDYEIVRPRVGHPYFLNADEERRITELLAARTLPDPHQTAVAEYVSRKVGRDWTDEIVLERLRRAIVAQKDDYWKPQQKRELRYSKGYSVLGYLAYHFPVYFMQTEHLLAMLARDGLLKQRMTILDVGTGPGVVPLAIAEFYSRLDSARADVCSLEQSEEHIEAFLFLRNRLVPRGGRVSIKPPAKADIRSAGPKDLPEKIDLLVFSNVLNELAGLPIQERADLVTGFAERLSPDGTILIAEPAEERTSTQLRILTLALKKRGFVLFAPCSFVWGTNCTPDRCWSFVTAPSIRPTRIMDRLAAGPEPFRYVNTDIKYSYAVLRKAGPAREAYRVPAGTRALRLSQIRRHADRRVNVIAAKMSEDLGDAKTHMFRLCDGSADIPVFAVLPSYHATPENEVLASAPYGTILGLEGVLVRYNREHDAYNLLVSRNTRITREKMREDWRSAPCIIIYRGALQ